MEKETFLYIEDIGTRIAVFWWTGTLLSDLLIDIPVHMLICVQDFTFFVDKETHLFQVKKMPVPCKE